MTQNRTTEYNDGIIIHMEDVTVATKLSLTEEQKQKKSKYNAAYVAENTTRLKVNLNHKTDADILAYLETVTNKQGLVKQLLRASMVADGFVYKPETDDAEG